MLSSYIIPFLACFVGDGHPYSDQCFDTTFETDTIVECHTVGGSNIPLGVNTGNNNPGNGVTTGYSTFMGERTVTFQATFLSRGFSQHPIPKTIYVVDGDSITFEGFEACSCYSRLQDGCPPE